MAKLTCINSLSRVTLKVGESKPLCFFRPGWATLCMGELCSAVGSAIILVLLMHSPTSDKHKEEKMLLVRLEPGLTAARPDKKKAPQLTSARDSSYSPTFHVSKAWAMMMWRKKQEITETPWKIWLICTLTSKKLWMDTWSLQKKKRKQWLMLLNLFSCTLLCLTFDFWIHILHRKITGHRDVES